MWRWIIAGGEIDARTHGHFLRSDESWICVHISLI